MSDKLGTVLYGSEHSSDEVFLGRDFSSGKNYSEKTAAEIDEEIRDIISSCYNRCKEYLTENIAKLHFVAEFLYKNESMDDEQFRVAMETENPTMEQIEQIAEEKKKKSREENKTAQEKKEKEEAEARAKEELENNQKQADADSIFPSENEFFTRIFGVPEEDKASDDNVTSSEEPNNNEEKGE
jgi:cell division protease FtsH